MNNTSLNAQVSYEGFTATRELQERVSAKVAKLQRHHATHLGSLHVHIRRVTAKVQPIGFTASATLRIGGRDAALHCEGAEPDVIVNELFSTLERMAQDGAGVRKHTRHATPAIGSPTP